MDQSKEAPLTIVIGVGDKRVRLGAEEKWRRAIGHGDLTPDTVVEIERGGVVVASQAARTLPQLKVLFAEHGLATDDPVPDDPAPAPPPPGPWGEAHEGGVTLTLAPPPSVTPVLAQDAPAQEAAASPQAVVGTPFSSVGKAPAETADWKPPPLTLPLFFSPHGRLGRGDFWVLSIGVWIVAWILAAIFVSMLGKDASDPAVTSLYAQVIAFWPASAVAIKRCHDRGQSGWWILVGIIPWLGPLWAIVNLGFLEGTKGPNKYVS